MSKPFAIVTGASSGIGLELAAICVQEGFELRVAADRPEIRAAADRFRGLGADVTVMETDLATTDGVERLWAASAGRPVDALLANAGHVVNGWQNKLQSAIANVTPAAILAEQHRRMAEPGSAKRANE